jgi:Ni/Fe-hydrogenase subunit HybB-like protein
MSARESSSWQPFLVVLGPVVALINQGSIYIVNMWACGHHSWSSMHVVPLLCLIVTATGTLVSLRLWRQRSSMATGESDTGESSSGLLTLAGVAIGAFSAAVIVAQWAAVITFDPCMQS